MLNAGMFIQNRYEIISKIGSGGMADVYKAKDHKLNRYVAVKVLKPEFREDKVFISKFRTEAQSAARLAHGNIVNIYDVGEESGINYIVMELVEGMTLKEYIKDQGRLSVKEATSIALQICAGLEAAHNNGIIHRDVKPQNIMISTDGKVKVADFGIARASTVNTVTSNVMGSVHYSSPEQARGGFIDAKSDIYSLGITFYEMLTGHVPFNGDTAVAIALQHLQSEMHGPKEEVPEIPNSTNQIVLKCTQKNPERRYPNMTELIRDLRESLVNPEGDFVKIPAGEDIPAMGAGTSREEAGRVSSGQKMPSYDESLDVGAAAVNKEEEETIQKRAYMPGSYYEKSQYKGFSPGNQYGDPDDPDDSDYHSYYDDLLDDPEDDENGSADDGYHLEEDDSYANARHGGKRTSRDSRQAKDELDSDLNPRLEKAVTIGGIIIAAVIGCVFLVLLGNAFGLFRFSSNSSDSNIDSAIVAMESSAETEKKAEKMTEQKAEETKGAEEETEPNSEKGNSAKETENAGEKAAESENETEAAESFALNDLSNMEWYDAQEVLAARGLKYAFDTSQFNDVVPSGYIISTDPEAGTVVTTGDLITLFVSQGREDEASYVSLWSLTGYTVDRAEEALSMLGLSSVYEYEPSSTVQEGNVIRTSADDAGGEVLDGGIVILYISSGPPDDTQSTDGENYSALSDSTDTASQISDTLTDLSDTAAQNVSGSWQCDASLAVPAGFTDQEVRITLLQNGTEREVFEGKTAFPYHLKVAGEDGATTGTAYVYLLDGNGDVTSKIEYSGIDFYQVD